MKTPDNLKKYGGKLEQDVHYVVKDDKIIFPSTLENPYKTKPYLSKVLKTIMDNAGVEFELIDVEQGAEKPVAVQKPKKEVIPPLTYTADTKDKAEKARTVFQKEIGEVPTVKYEIEAVESPEGRKYKLTVTGFQNPDQRAKLFTRKTTLKEEQEFDLERYQMLRRAGIIK